MKNKVFIIAEAGVNHNGSVEIAEQLIDAAKRCGADAVKFQTFKADQIASKYAPKAEYQKRETNSATGQLEMLQALELDRTAHFRLADRCKKGEIEFLSTPFDLDSVDLLEDIGVKTYKVASGEVTNLPLLIKIAKTNKPVILSTGMCEFAEVKDAIAVLRHYGTTKIVVLHCNTEYPTPFKDVNLRAMCFLGQELGLDYGYSDHTLGIEVPIAATALGALVIEKHFTLDRQLGGPDHKASLEPQEFRLMVDAIRNVELALGRTAKQPTESEKVNIAIARKSLVARQRIKKGELLSDDNVTVKRPGTGLSPMKWFDVIGQRAVRDFDQDELIEI